MTDDTRDMAMANARRLAGMLRADFSDHKRRRLGQLEEQVCLLGATCPREVADAYDEVRDAAAALEANLGKVTSSLTARREA